jgi:histidine phosphotransferase ChpT
MTHAMPQASAVAEQDVSSSEAEAQKALYESYAPTELELAALLASKICHDIISPVGAVNNGLEVLEEGSEEMKEFAMQLIGKSAKQSSAKLQFARIAFGAAGSAGSEIDTGDAQQVAMGYFEGEKANLTWEAERVLMPKNKVKLILNLLVVAATTIPRGGDIALKFEGDPKAPHITIQTKGMNIRIPAGVQDLIALKPDHPVDAHSIQPYYTGLLAQSADMNVSLVLKDDSVLIEALPRGQDEAAS